jgi:hypothetical protein
MPGETVTPGNVVDAWKKPVTGAVMVSCCTIGPALPAAKLKYTDDTLG